jgi:hypothetical protein
VLRLWRDRYVAAMRPQGVAVVRRRAGRKALDLKDTIVCEPAEEEISWAAPLAALREFLARPATTEGDLSVVLSNHFARFLIVPWNGEISNSEELQNYAAACFEDVYGEATATWEIRVSSEKTGKPRIACALDRGLINGLQEAVAGSKLRLVSVQPYLMTAFNLLSRPFRESDFVFVLAEAGRACFVASSGNAWRAVRTTAAPDDPELMAAFIEREVNLADFGEDASPAIYIHAPHRPGLSVPPVRGATPRTLELKPIEGFSPVTDGQYAMALAAA